MIFIDNLLDSGLLVILPWRKRWTAQLKAMSIPRFSSSYNRQTIKLNYEQLQV